MHEIGFHDGSALPSPAGLMLLSLSSRYIMEYVTRNPVKWFDRKLTAMGGPGDRAGRTPTPVMAEAAYLLRVRPKLYTQKELWEHCAEVWADWLATKMPEEVLGVKAKVANNFYTSLIDEIHAVSLLAESGWFDVVYWNTQDDAVGKVDVKCFRGDQEYRIALYGPGQRASDARDYKITNRSDGGFETIPVQMSFDRPVVGGKRWYRLEDFEALRLSPSVA